MLTPRGLSVASVLFLAACAHAPADPEARAAYERANDPAEPTNRVIFSGNQWVDRNALQPVARAYQNHVPDPVRKTVHTFASNPKEPGILVTDPLQANFSRAWVPTQRFVINTTVGGAGFFDVAPDWDRPYHEADFGQTLGVWGAGPGPAVQLPIFGPSNVRDSIGKIVGFVANPLNFVPGGAGDAVDGRAEMLETTDTLEKTSLDYYASLRSMQAQRRAKVVKEGTTGGRAKSEPLRIISPDIPDTDAPAPAAP